MANMHATHATDEGSSASTRQMTAAKDGNLQRLIEVCCLPEKIPLSGQAQHMESQALEKSHRLRAQVTQCLAKMTVL